MFQCRLCTFKTLYLKSYATHLQIHSNVPNARFVCVFPGCNNSYSVYYSLKSHIWRHHSTVNSTRNITSVDLKVHCNLAGCSQKCDSIPNLCSHLKHHIRNGEKVVCPFFKCLKYFRNSSSFASHVSRLHKDWSISEESIIRKSVPDLVEDSNSHSGLETVSAELQREHDEDNFLYISESVSEDTFEKDLLKKVALFILTMETKWHIPVSAVQKILREINTVHSFNSVFVSQQIKAKLKQFEPEVKLPTHYVEDIVKSVCNDPMHRLLHAELGSLRSSQIRKGFFKTNFSYVEPIAYKILNNCEHKHFHYIPLINLLKAFFSDPAIGQYLDKHCTDGILRDFNDGEVFKNKTFFQNNPRAIELLLYQDSFEIVNPLGSAKKKHC